RRSSDLCETAGTGGRAAWGGYTDRPRGGSTGHNSTNLGVGIHREDGGRAVKGHRGRSCEVGSANGHRGPHWPAARAEETDRRGGDHGETAGTGGRAGSGAHTDRPRGSSGGYRRRNLLGV